MENGFGDEERRTVPATMMENGDVYVAFGGAPRKTLWHNDLTLFRVGIFTTLKSVKHLSINHLQVALNVSS